MAEEKTNGVPLAVAVEKDAEGTIRPLAVLFLWNNGQQDFGFETDADAHYFRECLNDDRIELRSLKMGAYNGLSQDECTILGRTA